MNNMPTILYDNSGYIRLLKFFIFAIRGLALRFALLALLHLE